jgi:hypothetical protein
VQCTRTTAVVANVCCCCVSEGSKSNVARRTGAVSDSEA